MVTSGIDSHHGKFRFTWRMVLADGKVFLEGIDFGELNSDGKLHRIVGFFGPLAQAIGCSSTARMVGGERLGLCNRVIGAGSVEIQQFCAGVIPTRVAKGCRPREVGASASTPCPYWPRRPR